MNAIVERKEQSTDVAAVTPMEMLSHALARGADMQQLQQLMELQERWEATQSRKAFVAAMAAFKANPPQLVKDKHVEYTTSKGTTAYDHATLGKLCQAIIKGLADCQISHRWTVEQEQNRIKVTCVLTHAQGHSESVSLSSAADDSGGKNSIQAIGSAITYLQRYTLLAATGLAALDQDDDGKKAGTVFITEKQAVDLQAKAEEVGVNKENFLKFLRVERLSELPASKYNAAIQALNDRARGAK